MAQTVSSATDPIDEEAAVLDAVTMDVAFPRDLDPEVGAEMVVS